MRRLTNSLVWKLTIWFLLLSFLPLVVMSIFVRQTVSDTFADVAADETLSQVKLLSNEVSASTDDRQLHSILAGFVDESRFAFLIAESGEYLAHSDGSKAGGSVQDDFSADVATAVLSGGDGIMTNSVTGKLIGYSSVDGAFSTTVLIVDGSVVSAPMNRIERSAIIQLAVSLVLIAIAGSAAIWFVFKPIQKLTLAAEEVGAGNLDVQIDPSDMEGELEVLTTSFNQMTRQLREARDDLEQKVESRTEELRLTQETERRLAQESALLSDVGQIVSSTLDIDEVYDRFSAEMKKLVDFDRMAINIIDHDAGTFVFRYASGLIRPDRQISEVMPMENTQTKHVLETGKPLLGSDISQGTYYRRDEASIELGFRSSLMVPLFQKGIILGTLSLRSRNVDAYGPREQSILERLADHIAPAIANAELYTQRIEAEEALFEQTRESAVLGERNRMAKEIHDTLAQGFTGIVLQLEAGEQALDESPDEVAAHLDRAKILARESLLEARRSVWNLLTHALEGHSLEEALQEEVSQYAGDGQVEATFNLLGRPSALSSEIQTALLRICQESLTNARKHAEATEVNVSLVFGQHTVGLDVKDNGKGFDPETPHSATMQGGFGLTGMEQRAESLGGNLTVRSEKGKGTLVEVRLPT
jgi:signal transduction histidine kinase